MANLADISAMLDQLRRNLTPLKQIVFSISSTGDVIIHKQYGWAVPLNSTDIVLAGGTVVVTSRGSEFASKGMFVRINTNANYSWTNAGELRITAIFGAAGYMSVKIECEF